jgi:hypothetical protein
MDRPPVAVADFRMKEWTQYFIAALPGVLASPQSGTYQSCVSAAALVADLAVYAARHKYDAFCKGEN